MFIGRQPLITIADCRFWTCCVIIGRPRPRPSLAKPRCSDVLQQVVTHSQLAYDSVVWRSCFCEVTRIDRLHVDGCSRIVAMRRRHMRRPLITRVTQVLLVVAIIWTVIEALLVRRTLNSDFLQYTDLNLSQNRIFVTAIHWNNERILRDHWNQAVLDLVRQVGKDNVYVSMIEDGSWDDTKGALRQLDSQLAALDIPRRIILNDTTHADAVSYTHLTPPTKRIV